MPAFWCIGNNGILVHPAATFDGLTTNTRVANPNLRITQAISVSLPREPGVFQHIFAPEKNESRRNSRVDSQNLEWLVATKHHSDVWQVSTVSWQVSQRAGRHHSELA